MAQKVLIEVIDDIDGSKAAKSVSFSIDGKNFEIDLSDSNLQKFSEAMDPWISKARKTGGSKRPSNDGKEAKNIRKWAISNGYNLATRGRVPDNIREAYYNREIK